MPRFESLIVILFSTFLLLIQHAPPSDSSDSSKNLFDTIFGLGSYAEKNKTCGVSNETCISHTSKDLFPCYCDQLCKVYGDCCLNSNSPAPRKLFSCLNLTQIGIRVLHNQRTEDNYGDNTFGFVFHTCPPNTTKDLRERCEESQAGGLSLLSIPIMSNDSRLFRNVYCAICNKAHFDQPKVNLNCKEGGLKFPTATVEAVAKMKLPEDCHWELTVNETFRKCAMNTTHSIAQCPQNCQTDLCLNRTRHFFTCQMDPTRPSLTCDQCLSSNVCATEEGGNQGSIMGYHTYSIFTNFRRLLLDSNVENTANSTNATGSANGTNKLPEVVSFVSIARLTLMTSILSVIGLLLLIVVYSAVPALLNFGGVLTVSLAGSQLLGLLCFIVQPYFKATSLPCRSVAVLMFFAYFSSFAWMSLFAADVLMTFAKSTAAAPGRNVKRYAKFAAGGWLLPLIVTVAAVTMDALRPQSMFSPGFGAKTCFISSGYALLAWLYVPIAVAVVANAVMTCASACFVRRTMRLAKSARGEASNAQLVALIAKLSALFGLVWIFGLLASAVDNGVLVDAAGILSSAQGLFLSAAFLTTERVFRQVKARLRCLERRQSSSTRLAKKHSISSATTQM